MSATVLSVEFWGLAGTALLLGIRHGLDADHLATIDGLTRFNAAANPTLARRSGSLFSIGHGLVVAMVALLVSTIFHTWTVPAWIKSVGGWLSITILLLLVVSNLFVLLRTPSFETVRLAGWRTKKFARLFSVQHAHGVIGVGILFAVSFDTLTQAAIFGVLALKFGGWNAALLLAALFVSGMILIDGINSLCLARLIDRADKTARITSRLLAVSIVGLGLITAASGIATQIRQPAQSVSPH